MIKLIGILIGSALAVAFLIVALGMPDFSAPEPSHVPELEAVVENVVEAIEDKIAEAEPEPVAETAPDPQSEADIAPEPVAGPAPDLAADPETEALIEQIFNPGPEELVVENWYAFWSPFRSEIAARGFVSKLQETTGIDYRVVKVKTGVYEVAFAYTDDADIQDKLARISSATGLDMTDS